jgi:hypothetical protein
LPRFHRRKDSSERPCDVDDYGANVNPEKVAAARAFVVATVAATAACSLLLSFDGYDRDYGAVDGPPEATTEAATDGASDGGTIDAATDSPLDAPPACVAPAPGACDADIATDPANCGACGHVCLKPNSACTVGVCDVETVFWIPFVAPMGVALDDNYFYGVGTTTLGSEGGVARGPKSGGSYSVLALWSPDPRRIAPAPDHVYWTQAGGIARCPNNPLPDGGANTAELFVGGQHNPFAIAVDDTYVFWTNPPPDGEVWRATIKSPGDAKAVVAHSDGQNAYGLAVDATYVYWTSFTQGGAVWRMSKTAGDATGATKIADGLSFPSDLFVDGEAVYWTNGSSTRGAVMKLARGASGPDSLAGPRPQPPAGVFVRDPFVYWHEGAGDSREIWRVSKCGGTPIRLVIGQKVTDLAVEDKNVYWATGQAINRVAR